MQVSPYRINSHVHNYFMSWPKCTPCPPLMIIQNVFVEAIQRAKAGINVSLPDCWSQMEVRDRLMVRAMAVNEGKSVEVNVDGFE